MDGAEFAKSWEQTRRRGFGRFVVSQSATWGISVSLAVLFGEWTKNGAVDPLHGLAVLAAGIALGCASIASPRIWGPSSPRRAARASIRPSVPCRRASGLWRFDDTVCRSRSQRRG